MLILAVINDCPILKIIISSGVEGFVGRYSARYLSCIYRER